MIALLTLLTLSAAPQDPAILYRLQYRQGSGRVEVTLELPDLQAPRTLVMPRAIPMGYGEQPYHEFVRDVVAYSPEGRRLRVEEVEGPRWHVPRGTVASLQYEVDVGEMEQRIRSAADTSKIRPGYVGLLGYSVFAFVEGQQDRPVRLEVGAPPDWPVFSTLAPRVPPPAGQLSATAAGFYALADSQIALGPEFRALEVPAAVPLYLLVYAEGKVDLDLIGRLAREAMEPVVEYFGSAPFPHYTVHQEYLRPVSDDHEYGFSMEHLDSGTFFLAEDRALLPGAAGSELWRARYDFAHHFAHSWIPKRAYGDGYFPFSWEFAPVLDSIWFSEGFAQYAAMVALAPTHPAGAAYVQAMVNSRFGSNVEQAPASIRDLSLVELSHIASTRYSSDFRTGRNVFSRGGMMAAEMDRLIQTETGGEKSLRDGLRHLFAWSQEHRRPFRIGEIPEILQAGTGVDLRHVYLRWLSPQR